MECPLRSPSTIALLLVFCLSVGLACAGSGGGGAQSENQGPRKDIVIRIGNDSLYPQTAEVATGGSVAWVNDSSYSATVSFPMSVLDGLSCSEIRPDFYKTADRITSIPIQGGTPDLVLPCPLEPGVYEYTANLFSGMGSVTELGNPQLQVPGKIVVK